MGYARLVIGRAGSGKLYIFLWQYYLDGYNMVNFQPLDLRKESRYILAQIDDNHIQYGEDVDVKIREFDPDKE